jgi:putative ABC transport system permease protein
MNFVLKAALRDLRFDFMKLALAVSAISAGVAAITAVSGLGDSVLATIGRESRNLLGADLILESRKPLSDDAQALADSLPGARTRIVSMATMAFFPKADVSRLVQLRALDGRFPLYGTFTVVPEEAAEYQQNGGALVDESLQLLYNLVPGDTVKIGHQRLPVRGVIKAAAGEAAASAFSGPRVYIPLNNLEKTGLIQTGSLVTYQTAFASSSFDYEAFNDANEERLRKMNLRTETVKERQRSLGRATENLTRFLGMIGLFTLLIGGAGVAGAVSSYIKRKHKTVAVLRCIGVRPNQAVAVYIVQTVLFAAAASLIGFLTGLGLLYALPALLKSYLPFEITVTLSLKTIVMGSGTGILVSLLFSAGSMAGLRKVTPLAAIRSGFSDAGLSKPLMALLGAGGLLALWGVASVIARSLRDGAIFTASAALVLVFFVISATAMVRLVRSAKIASLPFYLKNALSGLFRPNNQTTAIVTVVGFSVFLITLIAATQTSLLREVENTGSGGRPNMMLIDIQPDQRDAVKSVLAAENAPPTQLVPIVTMRITSLEGLVPDSAMKRNPDIAGWSAKREYRSSYRNALVDTEKLLEGTWPPAEFSDVIPVSLEKDIARQLGLSLNDTLVFDVQGVPFTCAVAAIREVDWQSLQPNFFVIFPDNVLEAAPQFFVAVARTATPESSARIKRNLALDVPNVTIIDLDLIVRTVEGILNQVAWVLRFMSLFTLATGLIVFAASMYATRAAREKESAVLRTLGAAYATIRNTSLTEFALVGAMASIFGMLLALIAAGIIMELIFQARVAVNMPLLLVIPAGAVVMLMVLGWLMNRRILSTSPMQLLRTE